MNPGDKKARPKVVSVQVGRARPFGPHGKPSAIFKQAVVHPVEVSETVIEVDEQGDRRHHGGVDMAVHQYAFEHYGLWRDEFPAFSEKFQTPGAFGENLSSLGMDESTVAVGDVYRIGDAVLQVSQARQPCWKLNWKFGIDSAVESFHARLNNPK